MARQGARYARLAGSVRTAAHDPRRLEVSFAPDYDRALLDEAIAIERECCPFFAISLDHGARRLVIEVPEDENPVLLDGIASALGAAPVASP